MVAPRPASIRNFWSPASTSVQGPKRSGLGIGTPVPSSVTRKSLAVIEWCLSWIDLDAGVLDDLAPVRGLGAHQRAERVRRAAAGIGAELGERLPHPVGLERLVDRRIEPRDHGGRRAGLQQNAGPVLACELRVAG